jgi:hypothetical protein
MPTLSKVKAGEKFLKKVQKKKFSISSFDLI